MKKVLQFRKYSCIVGTPMNNVQKQPPDVFHKKSVLKRFKKFTGKHLCRSLLFIKVAGLILKVTFGTFFCRPHPESDIRDLLL